MKLPNSKPIYFCDEDNLADFRNPGDFIPVYHSWAKVVGFQEAGFLQYLNSTKIFYRNLGKLIDGKWFYSTIKDAEDKTTFSNYVQSHIITKLLKIGAISMQVRGLPPRRYFCIHNGVIEKLAGLVNTSGKTAQISISGKTSDMDIAPIKEAPKTPTNLNNQVPRRTIFKKLKYSSSRNSKIPIGIRNRKIETKEAAGPNSLRSSGTIDPPSEDSEITLVTNTTTNTTLPVSTERDSFLPQTKTPTKATPSPMDRASAVLLRKLVQSRGKFVSSDKTKWAIQFAVLREQLSAPPNSEDAGNRIRAALEFYLTNFGKPGYKLPDCWDGKQFKSAFNWIEGEMKKTAPSPQLELPTEMVRLAKNLKRDYNWPKGSETFVDDAVNIGYSSYVEFRDKIRLVVKGRPTMDRLRRFVHNVVLPSMGSAEAWVGDAAKELRNNIKNWKAWSGSKKSFIGMTGFAFESEKFQSWGANQSTSYAGSMDLWNELMKEIKCG